MQYGCFDMETVAVVMLAVMVLLAVSVVYIMLKCTFFDSTEPHIVSIHVPIICVHICYTFTECVEYAYI